MTKLQNTMYQQIPMDIYLELLNDRFHDAQDWWGNEKTEALWQPLLELIEYEGVDPEHSDPKEVVDNYVVNSKIVSRSEFERGDFDFYYRKYDGDWESLLEDSIVNDGEFALMQF